MTDRPDRPRRNRCEGEQQGERDQTELSEVGDEQGSNEHDDRQGRSAPAVAARWACRLLEDEKPRRGASLAVWVMDSVVCVAPGSSPWPDETRP
jgi:hypothetical protein